MLSAFPNFEYALPKKNAGEGLSHIVRYLNVGNKQHEFQTFQSNDLKFILIKGLEWDPNCVQVPLAFPVCQNKKRAALLLVI